MTWGFYLCPLGRGCAAYGPWSGAAQLQGGGLTAPLKGSILNIEKRVLPANGQPPSELQEVTAGWVGRAVTSFYWPE